MLGPPAGPPGPPPECRLSTLDVSPSSGGPGPHAVIQAIRAAWGVGLKGRGTRAGTGQRLLRRRSPSGAWCSRSARGWDAGSAEHTGRRPQTPRPHLCKPLPRPQPPRGDAVTGPPSRSAPCGQRHVRPPAVGQVRLRSGTDPRPSTTEAQKCLLSDTTIQDGRVAWLDECPPQSVGDPACCLPVGSSLRLLRALPPHSARGRETDGRRALDSLPSLPLTPLVATGSREHVNTREAGKRSPAVCPGEEEWLSGTAGGVSHGSLQKELCRLVSTV